MRTTRTLASLMITVVAITFANTASASILGLTSIQNTTGPGFGYHNEIETTGTLLDAINLGHTGANIAVNGVTFVSTPGANPSGANWSAVGASNDDGLGNSGIDDVFFSELWNGVPITLTYNNLLATNLYTVQILHGEPRNCCSGTFAANTVTTDVDAATVVPAFTLGNGVNAENPPAVNDIAIVEFQLTGATTFTYDMNAGAGRGPSIAGFQVRDLGIAPSPSVDITGVANGSTPPTIDNGFGSLDIALNLGNGGALTRDGVNFANASASGANPVYGTAGSITVAGVGASYGNATIGADPLFHTESFFTPQQLVITGLDIDRDYQLQLLFGEGRALTYNNGLITATVDGGVLDTDNLTFGPVGSGTEFAILTLLASDTTTITIDLPAAGRGPSIAGVVLHSVTVPSPAALPAGLLGIGLIAARRRQ